MLKEHRFWVWVKTAIVLESSIVQLIYPRNPLCEMVNSLIFPNTRVQRYLHLPEWYNYRLFRLSVDDYNNEWQLEYIVIPKIVESGEYVCMCFSRNSIFPVEAPRIHIRHDTFVRNFGYSIGFYHIYYKYRESMWDGRLYNYRPELCVQYSHLW